MFLKLFNWLLKKKLPYFFSLIFLGTIIAVLAGTLGGVLVLSFPGFKGTMLGNVFIITMAITMILAVLFSWLEAGFLRIFGIKWEAYKEYKIINDNLIGGHFSPGISSKTLLECFDAIKKINSLLINRTLFYTVVVIVFVAFSEFLVNGFSENILIIVLAGLISLFALLIFATFLYDLLTQSARKECKMLLFQRNISFNEYHSLNLDLKFKLLTLLVLILFFIILGFTRPLNLSILFFPLVGLIMVGFGVNLVSSSINVVFDEIRHSARNLVRGGDIFFSGSQDKEMIDLSESLNTSALESKRVNNALEEERSVLEIKVKSRTKELEDLTNMLEKEVQARTKKLQEKINELEKFQKLTIGREMKMVELKEEIKNLKKNWRKLKVEKK